ncbi:hypothetical protein TRVL_05431 [Trypanosoma vivax]|nr:hypothetical protein TRVL_05431 [Trypanosoma vivax]
MYRYGSSGNELQREYTFGEVNASEKQSKTALRTSKNSSELEEVSMFFDEEKQSPRSNRNENEESQPSVKNSPGKSPVVRRTPENRNVVAPVKNSAVVVSTATESKKDTETKNIINGAIDFMKANTSKKVPEGNERAMLEQRWLLAQAEEKRLDALEARLTQDENSTERLRLAPNFPNFLCIKPMVYYNLESVPEQRRRHTKLNFYSWIFSSALHAVNSVVAIIVVFMPDVGKSEVKFDPAMTTILAIIYLLGIPAGFVMYHWPVYKACCSGRSTMHLLSLCGLLLAALFCSFMFIGPVDYAACGILFAIATAKTKSQYLLIPICLVAFMWAFQVACLSYTLWKQWILYRLDVRAQQVVRRQMENIIGV